MIPLRKMPNIERDRRETSGPVPITLELWVQTMAHRPLPDYLSQAEALARSQGAVITDATADRYSYYRDRHPTQQHPESAKLLQNRSAIDTINEFLEWLGENGMYIGKHTDNNYLNERLEIVSHRSLIPRFFNIDETKLDDERREILEEARKKN